MYSFLIYILVEQRLTNIERKALQDDNAFNKLLLIDVESNINTNVKSVEHNLRLEMTNIKETLTS